MKALVTAEFPIDGLDESQIGLIESNCYQRRRGGGRDKIVADEFAIDPDQVILMPTSTEKSNNTSPTAASARRSPRACLARLMRCSHSWSSSRA